jgi:hypothetical protein
MNNDCIDLIVHKENLKGKIQNLKSECSSKGIGGKSYLSKLSDLLLEDIRIATKYIYNNYLDKIINENNKIPACDLSNEISKRIEDELFDIYRWAINLPTWEA